MCFQKTDSPLGRVSPEQEHLCPLPSAHLVRFVLHSAQGQGLGAERAHDAIQSFGTAQPLPAHQLVEVRLVGQCKRECFSLLPPPSHTSLRKISPPTPPLLMQAVQAGLELLISLPPSPKSWDYRCVPRRWAGDTLYKLFPRENKGLVVVEDLAPRTAGVYRLSGHSVKNGFLEGEMHSSGFRLLDRRWERRARSP